MAIHERSAARFDGLGAALDGPGFRPVERAAAYMTRNARSLQRFARGGMPDDVRDEEISVVLAFRASLVLNGLTGGDPDMTFSAACHERRIEARHAGAYAFWSALALGIDLACAIGRGETEHCATAWENHRARCGARHGDAPTPSG